jgi:hypothetical protein
MKVNQLSEANKYNIEKCMRFGEPQEGKIPNTSITYTRIPIETINEDGTVGDLIFPTEICFSFGISPTTSMDGSKTLTGYSMSLCLHDRGGPTKAQKVWVETFENIVERAKLYLIEECKQVKTRKLDMRDLRGMSPLYYKTDEEGERVEGMGPTLYAKLIVAKNKGELYEGGIKIITQFYGFDGEHITEPLEVLNTRCDARAAIKIESIFIGKTSISLQVKLYECEAKRKETGMPRLLSRPKANPRVLSSKPSNSGPPLGGDSDDEDDDEDETGSLGCSDDEIPFEKSVSVSEPVPSTKTKRKVRKVKKVIKKR